MATKELKNQFEARVSVGRKARARTRAVNRQIIFLNRFFYPDHSATSQILGDLAFHLADHGHAVRVFTSRQRYDDPTAWLSEAESVDGVAIHRLATTRFGRSDEFYRGGLRTSAARIPARRRLSVIAPAARPIGRQADRSAHMPNWLVSASQLLRSVQL